MNKPYILTQYWLEKIVIGLELCPFARQPYERGAVLLIESYGKSEEDWQNFFYDGLEKLNDSVPELLSTVLLIFPLAYNDFTSFNDLVGEWEDLLKEAQLDQHFQLVTFHPRFKFAGLSDESLDHYINRSPYPTVQIIRSAELKQTQFTPEQAAALSLNNGKKLQALGLPEIKKLFSYLEN